MRRILAVALLVVGCGEADGREFAPEASGGEVSTGGAQQAGETGGAPMGTGGVTVASGGASGGLGGASAGGAPEPTSGGAGGAAAASGGAASGGVVATGGVAATGGAVATGGMVSTGGVASTGGASSGWNPGLSPYPAPDCAGFTAYWVPKNGCIVVTGRFQTRSPGLCDIQNPTVKSCVTMRTDLDNGIVGYVRAEPGKEFAATRVAFEGCAERCSP